MPANKLLWNKAVLEELIKLLKDAVKKLHANLAAEISFSPTGSLSAKLLAHLLHTIEIELKQLDTINITGISDTKIPVEKKPYRSFQHLNNFLGAQFSDISLIFRKISEPLQYFTPYAKGIAKEVHNILHKIYAKSLTESERLAFDRKLQAFCLTHEKFIKLFFPYQGKAFYQYLAYIENPKRETTELNCHFEFMQATFSTASVGYDISNILENNEKLISEIENLSCSLIDTFSKKANTQIPPMQQNFQAPTPSKDYRPSQLGINATHPDSEQKLYEKLYCLQEKHPDLQKDIESALEFIEKIKLLHLEHINKNSDDLNLILNETRKTAEIYLEKISEDTGSSALLDQFYEFYISLITQAQVNTETAENLIFEEFYSEIAKMLEAGQIDDSLVQAVCPLMEIAEEKFTDLLKNPALDTDICIDALLVVSTAINEIPNESIQEQLCVFFEKLTDAVCEVFDTLPSASKNPSHSMPAIPTASMAIFSPQ